MPSYLAPGVYVEEIAGPRTIQGVSTSTAAFVGPCRSGPTSGSPALLTSYLDFQRTYGDDLPLTIGGTTYPNYLAIAARGFFDEGGASLYVQRVFTSSGGTDTASVLAHTGSGITVTARSPGLAGQMLVTFTLAVGPDVLVSVGGTKVITRVSEYDAVYEESTAKVYTVRRNGLTGWRLNDGTGDLTLSGATHVYPLTVRVEVRSPTVDSRGVPTFGPVQTTGTFDFDPRAATGISNVLTASPATQAIAASLPIQLDGVGAVVGATPDDTASDKMIAALFDAATVLPAITSATATPADFQNTVTLGGGTDGAALALADYAAALAALEAIDDISIVAAPGATAGWGASTDIPQEVNSELAGHCERMQYRVAALDTPPGLDPTGALAFRNLRSSDYAALYYPWITVSNPVDGSRLNVPPSGFMAGIWARSDTNYGVFKAPANEVVRSAVDFERRIKKAEQELLNPQGVNCLRFFPGPGFLVWGARTVSDDPEWKYLSMRRYFDYIEKSIDEGTRWVVFEVNVPALWESVRHTVEGFLLTEWKGGALLGTKPEQAYFVRCDLSTMTQDDLDNGRLICQVGIAAAKPAEFVIFRISQWTATATS
jgi:phage tail sheath protein FI